MSNPDIGHSRATSDTFPVALTLTVFLLMSLGQSTYEEWVEASTIALLEPWLGDSRALLVERLAAVALTIGIALYAVCAVYFRARRELEAGMPRNPKDAMRPGVQPRLRDVWLYDAICRIFLGRWDQIGLKRGALDLDQADREVLQDLVTRHIRQLAAEGTLPIWGRGQGYWALWEPIPPEYWRHHQVDYHSFLEADPKQLHALPCNGNAPSPAIGELMTSRASVEAFCESVAL